VLLHFAEAALEKTALAVVTDQRQGVTVGLRRFVERSETAQQVGTSGVQQVIVVQVAARGE
jgi:hypothetical protein